MDKEETQKLVNEIMKDDYYGILLHWQQDVDDTIWCYFLSQTLSHKQITNLIKHFNVYVIQNDNEMDPEDKETFCEKDDNPFQVQLTPLSKDDNK